MRRILAGTLALALLAVAFAAPPIDYGLTCGEDGGLIGVLSLTEGKVRVALVEGAFCDEAVFVAGPEGAPAIAVGIDWDAEPLEVEATVDEADAEVVDLVVVPEVAIDAMLDAQRLRAAAMEMRRQAAERGEAERDQGCDQDCDQDRDRDCDQDRDQDRDRVAWDDEGAPAEGEPGGPRGDGPGEGSGRRP